LQNERETLEPAIRAELVNRLAGTGLPRIEAASFVRADAVPQMAEAEKVVASIERREGVEYSGLALNERGYERLVAAGLDRVNFTLAATESFNRRNGNRSLAEAEAAATAVVERSQLPVTLTISCSFGDPFEGRIDPGVVAGIAERCSSCATCSSSSWPPSSSPSWSRPSSSGRSSSRRSRCARPSRCTTASS
jgi:hydroxymethylglutaryl-CoA lyase/(R)-citramalyl-CoA lyase